MSKKGTGWVPDFPDVRDYTLKSKPIQDLQKQVRADRLTKFSENLGDRLKEASDNWKKIYEDLAKKVSTLEKRLSEDAQSSNKDPKNINQDNNPVSNPFDGLLKEVTPRKLDFVAVKPHETPRPGMLDPEGKDLIDGSAKHLGELVVDPDLEQQADSAGKLEDLRKRFLEDLRKKFTEIENIRKHIRHYLREHRLLTPLIESWLDISDKQREFNQHKDTTPACDLHSMAKIVKDTGSDLKEKIDLIPEFWPITHLPSIQKKFDLISEKLSKIVLERLIHQKHLSDIEQLVKTVSSDAILETPDSLVSEPAKNSFSSLSDRYKKAIKDRESLKQQLQAFGIKSGDRISYKELIEVNEKINEVFEREPRRHLQYTNEEFEERESAVQEKIYSEELEQLARAVRKKIYHLIHPIVEVVFQILMPLGQHNNFAEAVQQGLETFDKLVIQAIGRDQAAESLDVPEKINPGREAAYLEAIALGAIREIADLLEAEFKEEKPGINDKGWEFYQVSEREAYEGSNIYKSIHQLVASYQLPDTVSVLEKRSVTRTSLEIINPEKTQEVDQANLKVPISCSLKKRLDTKFQKLKGSSIHVSLPSWVDLSSWCSPIRDQGSLDACTAHAGVALAEYFAKKAFGKYTAASSLFLYKATRNLMHRQGDVGASLRETMRAMVLFGIPPEEHWPYDEEKFDQEPTSFCYSFEQNYQALKYFRLDYPGTDTSTLLIQIKTTLLAGFPCMFGFTLYTSSDDATNAAKGYIPYPNEKDKMVGGHAVVAVGYDDYCTVENADGKRSQGAILIRNSWGRDWGIGGYGWLPYDYVLKGLTADWWSLLKSEWFDSSHFGVGASDWTSGMGRNKHGRR